METKFKYINTSKSELLEIIENKNKEIEKLKETIADLSNEIRPLKEKFKLMEKIVNG